jgi:hypothetical protein
VMIFERLARHIWRKCVMGVRQVGQLERHKILLDSQNDECGIFRRLDETRSVPHEFLNQAS